MIIIKTQNNDFLPIEYQKSTYPKIINTITTLDNLEVSSKYLENNKNHPDLLTTYLKQFYTHLNNYSDSIVIVESLEYIEQLDAKIIIVKKKINLKNLEKQIYDNTNN